MNSPHKDRSTRESVCVFHLTWTSSGSQRHPCLVQILGSVPAFLWKQIGCETRDKAKTRLIYLAHTGLRGFIRVFSEPFVPLSHRLPAVSIPVVCLSQWQVHIPMNFQGTTISRLETWIGFLMPCCLIFQPSYPDLLLAVFFLLFFLKGYVYSNLNQPLKHTNAVCHRRPGWSHLGYILHARPRSIFADCFVLLASAMPDKATAATWIVIMRPDGHMDTAEDKQHQLQFLKDEKHWSNTPPSSYIPNSLNTKVEYSTGLEVYFLTGNGTEINKKKTNHDFRMWYNCSL